MTALRTLSSALSLHEDPPSPPSDDFQFESEYVKSLLKERTPSPVVKTTVRGKENVDRWRTPVTLGASSGRRALASRDVNSLTRSQSVLGTTGENTPVVKLSSSQPAPSLSTSTTRYPRRGRLTRLGPPKRTSRSSSDSLEPSETDTPPEVPREVSILSTIPSSGTDDHRQVKAEHDDIKGYQIKGLRGLIQLQQSVLSVNGEYTPPTSQSTPPSAQPPRETYEEPTPPIARIPTPQYPPQRETTPPMQYDPSPRLPTPSSLNNVPTRRVSSGSTSSSGSSREGSAPRSIGRSSLRHLLASTALPQDLEPVLDNVHKGLEALTIKKSEEHRPRIDTPPIPVAVIRKPPVERDITQEYIPPSGTKINTLPTRRKSSPHLENPSPPAKSPSPKSQSPRRNNTPHHIQKNHPSRPSAPPKMRLLSPPSPKTKGKPVVMVNSRAYTRLSTIGRGGSSKVYKVIASTNKIYALKKVSFDKADQSAISGYKNEIRLLNRMAEREETRGGESRCVRLFDWEVCDDKGYLLMLMECGEIDFAHILAKHQGVPLGLNFIRVYWQQMLQAVQAIHEEKIVHSDLKPANFLLVAGQLKLIDFGIAKRMGDDTTNIHRDQQIGTVNYMSPEAILDTNHNNPSLVPGTGRLMKLGKKSDVWSLGCILYQMIYGKTPFSDLTMYQKIQSIPDETYPIKFPATGTGGVKVDRGCERCVRMCLARDQRKRWGIEELLNDRFLCGEGEDERVVGITVEEIGSLIEQTLGFGRMNGGQMLSKETIETLAKDAFDKLRATRQRE